MCLVVQEGYELIIVLLRHLMSLLVFMFICLSSSVVDLFSFHFVSVFWEVMLVNHEFLLLHSCLFNFIFIYLR